MLKFIEYNKLIEFLGSFDVNQRLLWYDFFIIIPNKATLPFMSLSRNFSDSILSNSELIAFVLEDVKNKDLIISEFCSWPHREDSEWIINEWVKYLNWAHTDAIVWYEFVF